MRARLLPAGDLPQNTPPYIFGKDRYLQERKFGPCKQEDAARRPAA